MLLCVTILEFAFPKVWNFRNLFLRFLEIVVGFHFAYSAFIVLQINSALAVVLVYILSYYRFVNLSDVRRQPYFINFLEERDVFFSSFSIFKQKIHTRRHGQPWTSGIHH